jgi:DTW domain-containing protein YfiP
MSRILCAQCQRPKIACICKFICKIDNHTAVLVLQHPSEVNQTKGTVSLLNRSLNNCQVLVGEDFSVNTELNILLANYEALLLYPSVQAEVLSLTTNKLSSDSNNQNKKYHKPRLLIIIDGTWKKAYRMFMLSSNLQLLKQVCLPEILANSGQYLIRKVAKKNALSSLEACCYSLALLENELTDNRLIANDLTESVLLEKGLNNEELRHIEHDFDCGVYQSLLDKFVEFNQFQLSFRTRISLEQE